MKTVSIMEAQHNLSKVLKLVEEGQAVYVTRRKQVIAKIVAAEAAAPVEFPDFSERARKTWGGNWQGSSSDDLMKDNRGDR